jgi:hypothetical protein
MTKNNYVGYEYKTFPIKQKQFSIYSDAYENFGWTLESTTKTLGKVEEINLNMKRDRKIPNKIELSRLQQQFESYASDIQDLESSKTKLASTIAYVIGVIGTVFMALSVLAVTSDQIVPTIIFGAIGLIGWAIPYFSFLKIKKNKTVQVLPFIDQKYEEIYQICKKANQLLEN